VTKHCVDNIESDQQVSFICEASCLNIKTTGHLKVHELFNSHFNLEFISAKEQNKLFNGFF